MKALLLLDFQNDFGAFGSLATPSSATIVQKAQFYLQQQEFALRLASQNWIPAQHPIFAANHYFRYPKQVVSIEGKSQRLWPIYGVQQSFGADWMTDFPIQQLDAVLQKGLQLQVAPYSCFSSACSFDLHDYLSQHQITTLVLGGFLTEFAVSQTALDALKLGYEVTVVKSLCAAANLDSKEDGARALKSLAEAGVMLIP